MDFKNMFLSMNGRLRRMHFWVGILILWVIEMVVMLALIGPAIASAAAGGGSPGPLMYVGYLLLMLLIWPAFALQIKRWHDRDKSWVWIFISFIPIVGPIWALVELGFLDGTPGPNKFGASPKGAAGAAPMTSTTV